MSTLDDAFWLEKEEVIKAAIHTLRSAHLPINLTKLCEQLSSCIIESYDYATPLYVYKAAWCTKISNVLKATNTKYGKSKPSWEHISIAINDKRLGITHYSPQPSGNVASSSNSESTSEATNSIAGSSTSCSSKQTKLSSADKEKIQAMFSKLDENKMWKLSTNTIVEKKMEEFALECVYEHPVHSMILDLNDLSWKKYLTDEDIEAIQNYESKELVELPDEINEYIKSLQQCVDAAALKAELSKETDVPAFEWIRQTLKDYLKLFKYNQLPLTDQSEGDIMRRIWFFIDTVFDDSKINCRGGEKSSKSSSATMNMDRLLAGEERMNRKMIGRKVDLLFKRQTLEYGCAECGRYDDQTKELYDGSFKMVKVLKDMLYGLQRSAPDYIHDFILAGFNVRIKRFEPMYLPEEPDDINVKLLPLLKSVYQARLTMEQSNELVRKYVPELKVASSSTQSISPCFNTGKRKRSYDTTNQE